MKKNTPIIAVLLALLASACSNDTEKIQIAAQGYLDAMGNYRPSDARAYAAQETQDSTLSYYESLMADMDPALYANNMPATITLGEINIQDTIAQVSYHKSTPITQQDGSLTLVKRQGEWLAYEVIHVPPIMKKDSPLHGRVFTEEEIKDMRVHRVNSIAKK